MLIGTLLMLIVFLPLLPLVSKLDGESVSNHLIGSFDADQGRTIRGENDWRVRIHRVAQECADFHGYRLAAVRERRARPRLHPYW